MHIEEVCIEGFKSYAQRTIVRDFDPKFNAITGLNGSGKSNILDSICFVLGITNLQHVRASSLQELVYKQGQAGITKATVSIVFNNNDRSNSPMGYEDCKQITVTRQIIIGGRNKYLINGHLAQPVRVQNLFHSVQLNVNNPHFLIMQGRITKVLNMKPPEILSMLEEAAGTRMYEMKKENALKTLEKKQAKVMEIDTMLVDEIVPALENLRKERSHYQEWAQRNADLDKLKRFVVAYEFSEAEKLKDSAKGAVEETKGKIAKLEEDSRESKGNMEAKRILVEKLISEKQQEMGPFMKKLEADVDELSKALVKETSVWTNKKETLEAEKGAIEQVKKNIQDLDSGLEEKEVAIAKTGNDILSAQEKVELATKALFDAEQEYQGVQMGKTGTSGEDKSLAEKLSEAKASAIAAETESKQAKLKIQHLNKELAEKQKILVTKEKEGNALQRELETHRNEVAACQDGLQKLAFDENNFVALEEVKKAKSESVRLLRSKVGEMEANLNVGFSFNDPVKGFNRSKVKGVVAKLIKVKDVQAATALEVIAGGKVYNVVVDTEQTGKLILEKGGLRRRVTIIPLNKIDNRTISEHRQARAVQLVGAENVRTAISLVDYDPLLQPAVAFIFGNHFVCKDSATAQKLAFHPDILTPCVTLEGDLFSPSGLLTGGSRRGGSLLIRLHELSEMEAALTSDEAILQKTIQALEGLSDAYKQHSQLTRQLEVRTHKLETAESRIQQSEHSQLSQEVKAMEVELENANESTSQAENRRKEFNDSVTSLEKAIKDHERDRDSRLKGAEAKIKGSKKDLSAATKVLKAFDNAGERLAMDKEASMKERENLLEQMTVMGVQSAKLEMTAEELQEKVASISLQHKAAEQELKEAKQRSAESDKEVANLNREQQNLKEFVTNASVEIKKLVHKMKEIESDEKSASKYVEDLLMRCEWIRTEKAMFGQQGTDYNFSTRDLREAKESLKEMETGQSRAEKRINKKVMSMFEKAEKEYNSLLRKKDIVQNDKSKIQKAIEELDEKKRVALSVTWQRVTKDFGSIFSTLLPGTMAKLDPPEGEDFMAGLEVKVAFGTVWKQSLSELSGGQRSLLALSLILALLLFKPAPLYILDEVDAALDLSHTQNIGRMIKSHFPQSQFIVVSLKEGMFNNANVIFRTKFVEGVSTVSRTVSSASQNLEKERGREKSRKSVNRSQADKENIHSNTPW